MAISSVFSLPMVDTKKYIFTPVFTIYFKIYIYQLQYLLFLFLVAYIIWYGTWTTAAKNIIQNFVANVGATPYWAINKAYGAGALTFKKSITDAYSQGKTLNDPWTVVQNAFNKKLLPQDTNGIYLVLSSR